MNKMRLFTFHIFTKSPKRLAITFWSALWGGTLLVSSIITVEEFPHVFTKAIIVVGVFITGLIFGGLSGGFFSIIFNRMGKIIHNRFLNAILTGSTIGLMCAILFCLISGELNKEFFSQIIRYTIPFSALSGILFAFIFLR